jgi:hypothetical protein
MLAINLIYLRTCRPSPVVSKEISACFAMVSKIVTWLGLTYVQLSPGTPPLNSNPKTANTEVISPDMV